MALKLSPPVIQSFNLEDVDKEYSTSGTTISVKQATMLQHEQRGKLYAEMVSRVSPDGVTMEVVSKFNQPELQRVEAWLTLTDCNIIDENDEQLFKFEGKGYDRHVSMSEYEFAKAWGKLPSFVANEIHRCVREVNPNWGRLGE